MLPGSAGAPGLPEHSLTRQCCLAFSGGQGAFLGNGGP